MPQSQCKIKTELGPDRIKTGVYPIQSSVLIFSKRPDWTGSIWANLTGSNRIATPNGRTQYSESRGTWRKRDAPELCYAETCREVIGGCGIKSLTREAHGLSGSGTQQSNDDDNAIIIIIVMDTGLIWPLADWGILR
ncbi:unnamed protein product [Linum trigynum]|uniref:Uncharacterized protein n=1 Tax=Linum trigynum TaxID=586398 RepID=A0AAV2FP82_9ROSI